MTWGGNLRRGSRHWRPPCFVGELGLHQVSGVPFMFVLQFFAECCLSLFLSKWNLKFGFFVLYIRQTVRPWNSHGKSSRIQRRSSLFGYGAHPWAGGANRRGSREIWEACTWGAWCGWLMIVASWKFNVRPLDTSVTRKDGLEADLWILPWKVRNFQGSRSMSGVQAERSLLLKAEPGLQPFR